MAEIILKEESYRVIGACFEVYNAMGCGFLESVYQECLELEFKTQDIPYTSKPRLSIQFKDKLLSKHFEADFVCFDKIILEIKAVSDLIDDHSAQLLNYLHATKLPLGLLINFGQYPKLQHKRLALTQSPN